jgi:hypothetical protein
MSSNSTSSDGLPKKTAARLFSRIPADAWPGDF